MKRIPFFLMFVAVSVHAFSQAKYESGYFIKENNEKINCLIRNDDWANNPVKFQYRMSADSRPLTAEISDIKEFGIGNYIKFKKFTVSIDKTTDEIEKLGLISAPEYITETLLLKTHLEGKATLYSYESGRLQVFFLQVDTTVPKQLVKKPFAKGNGQMAYNDLFRLQLLQSLNCGNPPNFAEIRYDLKDFIRIINEYNSCSGSTSLSYNTNKLKKSFLHLSVRPGLKNSSFKATGVVTGPNFPNATVFTFKNQSTFRLGFEAEITFPFNKGKWNFIIEPTYQYYKSASINSGQKVSADYKSFELPAGIRYYTFLNENSGIFLNVLYVFDFSSNSTLDFETSPDLVIKSGNSIAAGAGWKYKKKYSIELRYGSKKELLKEYSFWSSEYGSFSVILGFSFL
ncbi:MAG: hypothetical protein ACT4OJ_13440 [Bacteroidota bacterium]